MSHDTFTALNLKLHDAVRQENCELVAKLCRQGARADAMENEWNAFFLAILNESTDCFHALLNFGDPSTPDEQMATPLMLAMRRPKLDIVQELFERSDPWAVDIDGDDALAWLFQEENFEHDPNALRATMRFFVQHNTDKFFQRAKEAPSFFEPLVGAIRAELEAEELQCAARGALTGRKTQARI